MSGGNELHAPVSIAIWCPSDRARFHQRQHPPVDLPDGVIRLSIRGDFKLNKAPAYVDDAGWSVFHLNAKTVDWAESCNAARAQLFPDVILPAVDQKFEAIMQERAQRELAEKQAVA